MVPDEDFVLDKHPKWPNVIIGAGFSGMLTISDNKSEIIKVERHLLKNIPPCVFTLCQNREYDVIDKTAYQTTLPVFKVFAQHV